VENLLQKHPSVKIIACALDYSVDEHNMIIPGMGSFGDRYFGTD
jgi:uracil phosphoribosyltransferase